MKGNFPRAPVDLTEEWLSAALGRDVVGFALARIGADRGNLGMLVRLDFDDTPSLVAKFANDVNENVALGLRSGLFEREIKFYEELAPTLEVATPRCHGTWFDPETGHFLIILDHVETTTSLDLVAGIGPDLTAQVLDQAARLHGADASLTGAPWMQDMAYRPRLDNLVGMIERGFPRFAETFPALAARFSGEQLTSEFLALMAEMASLRPTVVHGDLKPDNLVAGPHGMVFLDWQAVGYGPPAWDVSNVMVTCLTIEDRRAHEAALLASYPHDLTGYERALWFGLVTAVCITLLGDPDEPRRVEVIRTMAERSLAALDDHGQT